MPSFSITRTTMTYQLPGGLDLAGNTVPTNNSLFYNIVNDLTQHGFDILTTDGMNGPSLEQSSRVILVPTAAVDPLAAADPWRILIGVDGAATMPNPRAGQPGQPTNVTVQNTGLYISVGSVSDLRGLSVANPILRKFYVVPPQFFTLTSSQSNVINLPITAPRLSATAPMTYALTVTHRGFVLNVWNSAITEDFLQSGIMCIQRGITCDGTVNVTGTRPLYMVTNISPLTQAGSVYTQPGPKNEWFYALIRQNDIETMDPRFAVYSGFGSVPGNEPLTTNTLSDNRDIIGAAINYFPTRWFTPVTNDTGEFILLFPFGLASTRFVQNDEIDLIAVSKADAYQIGNPAPINVYNQDRVYTSGVSNNDQINNSNGVRVFYLTGGEEFT